MTVKSPRVPISVVMPVYNGMDTLDLSLPPLLRQEGAELGKDYEIIVVDDGSTDGSGDHVQTRYPEARLIRHPENRGRIEARLTGVKAARFDRILLIDVRVIAADDILHTYWELGSPSPCMGVPEQPPPNRPLEQVFHCLRAAYYHSYEPDHANPRLVITEENFLRAPKGTTAIFLERRLYLDSLPEHCSKTVNDDTRLFSEMLKNGPLFRDVRLKIHYLQRTSFREEIPHLFERGVRFADYYLAPGGAYRKYMMPFFASSLLAVSLFFWQPVYTILGLLLILTAGSAWLARNCMDFIWLMLCLPVLLPTFASGALVGRIVAWKGKGTDPDG